MKRVVIVIPTYNETGTIEQLINKIHTISNNLANWDIYILIVDSNSPDGTSAKVEKLMKRYPKLLILKTKKEGLGKAYSAGFQTALNKLNPYLILEMDADLSHDPKEIPFFLKKIEEGADFVIGSRYTKGGSIPQNWGLHRKIFSIAGNFIIRAGFMMPSITDWTSGFRAMKSWIVKQAISHTYRYSGYVFQVAFLDFAIKNGAIIKETPINFKDRVHGRSKINSIEFIIQTLWYVFTKSPFIKFSIVGLIGFLIDFILSYLGIVKTHQPVWLITLFSTETAIISNFLLNNFWSFSHKKLEHTLTSYLPSFIKFNIVSSGSIAIQTIGIQFSVNIWGRKFWYIYKILIIAFIIIPYSYILYNKYIWKKR